MYQVSYLIEVLLQTMLGALGNIWYTHSISGLRAEKLWILKSILPSKDSNKGLWTYNLIGLVKGWDKGAHGECSVPSLDLRKPSRLFCSNPLLSFFPGLRALGRFLKTRRPALLLSQPHSPHLTLLPLVIPVATNTSLNLGFDQDFFIHQLNT